MSMSTPQTPQPSTSLPKRTLVLVMGGLLLGLLLGFLDVTIVATAGPTIISDLGGLNLYAWVFSAFIIVQTVVIPIFGKMSDLYGRKRFFLGGLAVFMLGSALSGASQSIYELILFRAVQGIGFGMFVPSTIAIAGDLFPPERRARVQGLLFSVNGIAFAVAPAAGSYLTQSLGWRWIFYVNLPVGVIAFAAIFIALKEQKKAGSEAFTDWGGAAALGLTLGLFLLGLSLGGSTFAWVSLQEFSVFIGGILSLVGFIAIERRSDDPVLPLRLFKKGAIPTVATVNVLRAMILFGLVAYIPLYAQAVLGGSVVDVRNVIYAFTLPVTAGTLLAGSAVNRLGFRYTILVGAGVLLIGMVSLQSISQTSTLIQLMEVSVPLGFGSGMMIAPTIAGFQNSVERREIGVGSSLATFTLNLGGAIGVSVLGAIQTNVLTTKLAPLIASAPPAEAATLGDPNAIGQILASPQALASLEASNPALAQVIPAIRDAFSQSITALFLVLLGVSVALLAAGLATRSVRAATVETIVPSTQTDKKIPFDPPMGSTPE
jgi:EmrB/QacA subfamily drug resistance transporter